MIHQLIPATYHDMHLSMLILVCLIIPVPTSIDCLAPGALQNWSTQMILLVVLFFPSDAICMMGVDEVLLQDFAPLIPLLILLLIRAYLGAG